MEDREFVENVLKMALVVMHAGKTIAIIHTAWNLAKLTRKELDQSSFPLHPYTNHSNEKYPPVSSACAS